MAPVYRRPSGIPSLTDVTGRCGRSIETRSHARWSRPVQTTSASPTRHPATAVPGLRGRCVGPTRPAGSRLWCRPSDANCGGGTGERAGVSGVLSYCCVVTGRGRVNRGINRFLGRYREFASWSRSTTQSRVAVFALFPDTPSRRVLVRPLPVRYSHRVDRSRLSLTAICVAERLSV